MALVDFSQIESIAMCLVKAQQAALRRAVAMDYVQFFSSKLFSGVVCRRIWRQFQLITEINFLKNVIPALLFRPALCNQSEINILARK